ncbi:hypothetical protein GGR72_001500 [Xanthomonas arboricola]|nr:hypothetical protein [Xanthomonas arboricola]
MTKVVGYPSGHAEVQVDFGSKCGQDLPGGISIERMTF